MINLGSEKVVGLRFGKDEIKKAYLGEFLIWDSSSGGDVVDVEFTQKGGGRWLISTVSGKTYKVTLSGSGIVRVNNKNQSHGTELTFTALGQSTELYFFDSSIQILKVLEV